MLRQERALITGAGRGIGQALAVCFAREGADLVLTARSAEQLESVAAECRAAGAKNVVVIPSDLSTGAGNDELAKKALEGGPITVLVNNAGAMAAGNATEGEPDEWDSMVGLNLLGPMRLTRRIAPGMVAAQHGVILNIGSVAAVEPMSGTSAAYAASKHGLKGWSTSIYQSLRNSNVKVCLINPAFVNTAMAASVPNVIPERMIQPEDLAEACLLPFRVSSACVPTEMTLRLTLSAMK